MHEKIPVTAVEFLNHTADLFKEKNIPDARLNAELMLCEILDCDRVSLYLNFDKPLKENESTLLKDFIQRRMKHEPLQYIIGKASFFGFDFKVNRNVLIPRPETELLVEKMLADIKEKNKTKVSIFEIGSGTGCISISLAKNLEKANVSYDIFSIDISKDAIEVAEENLSANKLSDKKVTFYQKDVFEIEKLTKSFDYLVSNPPYISKTDYDYLESGIIDFEPGAALTDSGDGLKFYKKIFAIAADKEFKGKVYCEIGFGQKESIEKLIRENNFNQFKFYKDYNNVDRILEIVK